ncbi:T9SS type A sorting domain-containing protein [Dyadobacter sp. CY312]
MYPNPVSAQPNIDNIDSDKIQKVILYNMTGKAVYTNNGIIKTPIDMTS